MKDSRMAYTILTSCGGIHLMVCCANVVPRWGRADEKGADRSASGVWLRPSAVNDSPCQSLYRLQ